MSQYIFYGIKRLLRPETPEYKAYIQYSHLKAGLFTDGKVSNFDAMLVQSLYDYISMADKQWNTFTVWNFTKVSLVVSWFIFVHGV